MGIYLEFAGIISRTMSGALVTSDEGLFKYFWVSLQTSIFYVIFNPSSFVVSSVYVDYSISFFGQEDGEKI